jgi:deoxyribose-phosphate aldolase
MKYSKIIDHSPLKMDISEAEVIHHCKEALEYDFYSMVVFPHYIERAKRILADSDVKLQTVVGFPFGNDLIETKAKQAELHLSREVDEIDMVMNISAFKSGNIDHVKRDIDVVLQKVRKSNAILKVILEVELLTDDEIVEACHVVADVGADFVKTSVGLMRHSKPAEVDTVKLMYDTVASRGLKVKASGGIHTTETFLAMIEAGASRVGTSKGIALLNGLKDILP